MKPEYPYELEPHELGDWAGVWGRWRHNANIFMLLGIPRRASEDIAATWPKASDDILDDILEQLDVRRKHRYGLHGEIILME